MAKTFEEADKLAENGKTNLDAINNPYKYVANAIQQGYTGFQAGQQMGPNLPGGGFQTQSDIASFLGGAAAGGQRMEDIAPLSQISPTLAQSFPEVADMPAKQAYDFITKMSSYFSQQNKQIKPITLGTKAQLTSLLKTQNINLTEEQLDSIAEPDAVKYVLENTKQVGRAAIAKGQPIESNDPMLDDYAKALNVPKESLVGKDAKTIGNWYGRIKTRQDRVSYGEPEPILNNDGDTIGYYQVSSQGKLASNTMPLAASASQKGKDLTAVSNIMSDLFNTAKGFEPENGPIQRFIGLKESIKARAGLAADKKAYIDSIDSFLGNLSREYSGERGVLTDQDVQRIKSAMPSLYDTEEEIDFKYKQILRVIAERQRAIAGGKLVVPSINKKKESRKLDVGTASVEDIIKAAEGK